MVCNWLGMRGVVMAVCRGIWGVHLGYRVCGGAVGRSAWGRVGGCGGGLCKDVGLQRGGFGEQRAQPHAQPPPAAPTPLPCPESPWVPLRVRILHQGQTLREAHANITMEVQPSPSPCPRYSSVPPHHCLYPQDPDFAEVLSDLSAHELQWLAQGQLRIVADTQGRHPRQLEGTITARRSCDSEQGTAGCGDSIASTPSSPFSPLSVPECSHPKRAVRRRRIAAHQDGGGGLGQAGAA